MSYGPVCASRESNPVPRCVGPILDRSSSSRMCRPLGSNQDVPLFRRVHGPPLPGRRTTLRSVRESNPPRCRDRAVASPDASQTRHQQVGAEGIEPPSRGNRPRALPLDDAPRRSGRQGLNLRSLASDASAIPLRYALMNQYPLRESNPLLREGVPVPSQWATPACARQEGVEPSAVGFGGPCPYRWGFCRRWCSCSPRCSKQMRPGSFRHPAS